MSNENVVEIPSYQLTYPKHLPIGTKLAWKNKILQIKARQSCERCYFNHSRNEGCLSLPISCDSAKRQDNTSVVFEEVDTYTPQATIPETEEYDEYDDDDDYSITEDEMSHSEWVRYNCTI